MKACKIFTNGSEDVSEKNYPHKIIERKTKMLETLKKTLFAGVGATILSADAVKKTLEDLVKKGKLSADDAKTAFDKAAARGEGDLKALYEKAATRGKETVENLTNSSQLSAIERRLAAIEEKLGITKPDTSSTPEPSQESAESASK